VARIIVMSEPSVDCGEVITLDERVAPAHMENGHHSAELIERVGWAVHDADERADETPRAFVPEKAPCNDDLRRD
jgi:hypothetical protein